VLTEFKFLYNKAKKFKKMQKERLFVVYASIAENIIKVAFSVACWMWMNKDDEESKILKS
jgi:hypothetical protein